MLDSRLPHRAATAERSRCASSQASAGEGSLPGTSHGMSRSPRQTAAFSFFTFLDVMLCTLGALIIVLICVVRTAQIKNADEAPENLAEVEEINSQRETVEWRAKHLAASREKGLAQLKDRRLELSHVEEHSRRLRMQVAELEAADAALAKDRQHDEKLD